MLIGVLGSGQLGRMLALAGLRLGMRFRFFDRVANSATVGIGETIVGEFGDTARLDEFRAGLDLVTCEFESVDAVALAYLSRSLPVCPSAEALEITQDRWLEKQLFAELGIPTVPHAPAESFDQLVEAIEVLGPPVIAKTRRLGYDGKGQRRILDRDGAATAWRELGGAPLLVEKQIEFSREVSTIAVAGRNGQRAFYPLTENRHAGGILRDSRVPAESTAQTLAPIAEQHTAAIIARLGYVGVLAVEWFQRGDQLLANEIAPRVHNSGHWTIDGAITSQFENHIRAICGLPLGDTSAIGAATMINLIGTVPRLDSLLKIPGAHVHFYDKEPAPGRKLGHVTVCEGVADKPSEPMSDLAARVEQVMRLAASESEQTH